MSTRTAVETPLGRMFRGTVTDNMSLVMQVDDTHYPDPEPACIHCPAASWYVTTRGLHCWCSERSYVSWVSNNDVVLVCDDCERLLRDQASAEHAARVAASKAG